MAVVAVITAAGDTAVSGILRAGLSMKSSREAIFPYSLRRPHAASAAIFHVRACA